MVSRPCSRDRRAQCRADARNGARVKTQGVPPQGVYRPNYNVLTPQMRSPEYVQMSTAAAITLGLMPGKMHRTQLHALPEPAGDLSRRLPCQLRLLRAGAPSRGGARLCRPQLHPRRLADCPYDEVIEPRFEAATRRVPAHVHLDDHPSEVQRRYLRPARALDARSAAGAGVDPVESDDHGKRRPGAHERPGCRHFHRRAGRGARRRSSSARAARA